MYKQEILFNTDGFHSWMLRRVHQIQAGFLQSILESKSLSDVS